MAARRARGAASAKALAANDPAGLWPEPAWLTAVADDPAYDWARTAWDRARRQPGAWYDEAKAEAVVRRFPQWFKLTEDRFAGLPFKLNAWQAMIVRLVLGWKIPVEVLDPETGAEKTIHVRLFRRVMLWVPRKNGKSEFLAALALLFWAYDAVMRGQGFVFARKESQARIIFEKMKAMIGYNAELAAGVVQYKKSLSLTEKLSPFELLPGTEDGTHGKSPTVIVGDEMHEWRTTQIATNLRQGTGARLQPIELYASTAGVKTNFTGYGLWEESLAILEGGIDDPTTLVVMFAAGPEDDPFDETVWRKANPSLGASPTLHTLRLEAAKAKGNPRAESNFRRYHLNQWVDSHVRWLPVKKWDACAAVPDGWKHYPETLRGREAFAAFDLSSTRDITALVLVFPPTEEDPKWRVMPRFWVPELTLEERVREDRVPYDHWVKMIGHNGGPALETTPGDYVDQNYVLEAVLAAKRDYDVQLIGYDPWGATKLIGDLEALDMPPELFQVFRQGIPSYAEPSKHFERLVFAGLLDHGGHPVLRWMAQNAVVRTDANMNFMPAKNKSAEKIDGIVATVMAVGLACQGAPDEPEFQMLIV